MEVIDCATAARWLIQRRKPKTKSPSPTAPAPLTPVHYSKLSSLDPWYLFNIYFNIYNKQLAAILPLAVVHTLGNLFTNTSLGKLAVSFTHTNICPEYANSGLLNEKSDVYSLGVLLLEAITGRDPVDYSRLAAENGIHSKSHWEFVDPDSEKRPKMSQVVRMLESKE